MLFKIQVSYIQLASLIAANLSKLLINQFIIAYLQAFQDLALSVRLKWIIIVKKVSLTTFFSTSQLFPGQRNNTIKLKKVIFSVLKTIGIIANKRLIVLYYIAIINLFFFAVIFNIISVSLTLIISISSFLKLDLAFKRKKKTFFIQFISGPRYIIAY